MLLPEGAEALPLSVNQEKGRNGEPPDLPDPSTDSLEREHPAWAWAPRGRPGPQGTTGEAVAEAQRGPLTCCPWTNGCCPCPSDSC